MANLKLATLVVLVVGIFSFGALFPSLSVCHCMVHSFGEGRTATSSLFYLIKVGK